MLKNKGLYRGLGLIFVFLLVLSITMASIMETYRQPLDENTGSTSSTTEVESDSDDWTYESDYTTAKEAVEGMRELAIQEAVESCVLLKNEGDALPLSSTKVTMMGIRSYAPVYGSNGGSIPSKEIIDDGNTITEAFQAEGFDLNPSMLATYESYFSTQQWGPSSYGAVAPEYDGITDDTTDPHELDLDALASINSNYNSEWSDYNTAIVLFGRPGGEQNEYRVGAEGLADGVETTTGNILSLSTEEKEILSAATENFETVIVLINAVNQMDIAEIEDNEDVDAIMWIGGPGPYGFYGVADVLKGDAEPSGRLGDTFATNNALAPGMVNFGDQTYWSGYSSSDTTWSTYNLNSYVIENEGIYDGYRYYETRYADIVYPDNVTEDASSAAAGTYVESRENPVAASTDGTWSYANEVVYTFGYGLSYTEFTQTLDKVTFSEDNTTAYVTVTAKNTGETAGKTVIQVYGQSPYTAYDKANYVEKSAIQLLDYEKTETLDPGDEQTITLNVDIENLASYDYTRAKTFIMDTEGTYYLAIGDDAHDALNNVLAANGLTPDNTDGRMDATGDSEKTYSFTWNGTANGNGVDATTFAYGEDGETQITNQLTEGIYAMDYNYFQENTVTYLSRNNWITTYPEEIADLAISTSELEDGITMQDLAYNDFIDLATNETSDVVFGDTESELTFADMKGVAFDDEKWDELVSKITIDEILDFMANAFHNIEGIDSIEFEGYSADDGPGGSDSYTFGTSAGSYRGELYEDRMDYEGYGTRIAPAPINLAYTFNKELAYENGSIVMGESTLMFNLPIIIGPAMNIHRNAYNGRGVEYYSEDPILSGFTGSAVVQGAQAKGCLVNIKHAAFNDQEINRSGVSIFMNEQKARELELRNLKQAFTAKGRPASVEVEGITDNSYENVGALGVMTSYNRIGIVASSANYNVQVNILRNEWGFIGYNVTDFTGVALKAAPKESILAGTTCFCGMGSPSVDYWSASSLSGDADMLQALHDNMKYALYALANSYAMDLTINTHSVWNMTWWRAMYISMISVSSVLFVASAAGYTICAVMGKKKSKKEA